MVRFLELDGIIANNIRDLRAQANLTQPQVASHLGIAYQSYQKMEGGRVSFRASTLVRLSQLYDVTLDWMVERRDEGGNVFSVDPIVSHVQILLLGMSERERNDLYRAAIQIKHGG